MHMYFAFGNNFYIISSVPLVYSLFDRHISFSLFMSINFNIIHILVSINNTNAYVLRDSHKYIHSAFIFVHSYL